jgi:hypothetical protein
MRTLSVMAVLGVLALGGRGALAQPASVDDARRFFEAGRQAYEAGQYVVAITAFEEAHRLAPRPSIVFALGQALRRQYILDHDSGKLERALLLYRDYVTEVPQGERRDEAVGYLGELEPVWLRLKAELYAARSTQAAAAVPPPAQPKRTQLMISSLTRGARGGIDGATLAEVPVIQDVTPGKHTIRVALAGYFPEEVEGIAVEGHLIVVEVNLRERPALVAVRAPADAEISVDGRVVGKTPLPGPVPLAAGRHVVTIAKRGHYPEITELTLFRGQSHELEGALEATTQRRMSTYVLWSSLGCFLLGGVTLGLSQHADREAKGLADKAARENISSTERDDYNRQLARRDDWLATSGWVFGGAAVLAAAGALLYWVDNPRVDSPPPAPLVPTGGALGLGLARVSRF